MSAPLSKEIAKRMVEDYLFETYAKKIDEINEEIKAAANKGNYFITIDADFCPVTVYSLFEERGFNIIKIVKANEKIDRDRVMISWRD